MKGCCASIGQRIMAHNSSTEAQLGVFWALSGAVPGVCNALTCQAFYTMLPISAFPQLVISSRR